MAAYRRHVTFLLQFAMLFIVVDISLCEEKGADAGADQAGEVRGLAGNLENKPKFQPAPGAHEEDPYAAGDFPGHGTLSNPRNSMPVADARNPMDGNGMNSNQNPSLNKQQDPLMLNVHNATHMIPVGKVDDVSQTRLSKIKISKSVECAGDVQKFCSQGVRDNNFAILDCLQSDERTSNDVSPVCQHFLWKYKQDLTKDDQFDTASTEMCALELNKISECRQLPHGQGLIIPCLIENLENITTQSCQKFLNKMAGIIFSDYRYIYNFAESCKSDIEKYQCGRLHLEEDDSPHSQGRTVECVAEHLGLLTPECRQRVLRVYILNSRDFHMDRPLFYACQNDREKLCEEVKAGNGAVFQCLFDHLGKPELSAECREKLELRQRLMSQDVRVEHSFYSKCLKDIEKHHCLGGSTGHENTKRAHVLLCLKNVHMSEQGTVLDPVCIQEMIKVRQRLMEDYRINPDLMVMCGDEIEQHCKGLEPGGNTLHCLMKLARQQARDPRKRQIRDQCRAQLSRLLKEVNVAEDYRLDKPLQIACGDVVTAVCSHIRPGGGAIINCLMDNMDEDEMTDECEDRLLDIQFFVARDFKLDPDLFKSCKQDAKRYCHESGNWADLDKAEPEQGTLMLFCLRRHYYHHGNNENVPKLSRACIFAVQRVMRRRSQSVDMHPEIEEACVADLGDKCSEDKEDVEKGAEIECLQMNYEILNEECKKAIAKFTEEESEDIQMDAILMKACTPMIRKFCESELDNDAEVDDVLECLIEHKNHMDMQPKCAAGIEHHQLVAMKDFRFNHKFKTACQKSAQTLCKHMTTKHEVMSCLSEHVHNDMLLDKKQRVEHACQKQLKVELLQRGESIKLDPELMEKCSEDIRYVCGDITPGNAGVLECLKKHNWMLSKKCSKLLFKREEIEFAIADYAVIYSCKKMIGHFCDPASTGPELFDCLKKAKDDDSFDEKCRRIVIQRQITQSRDYRLNPLLQKSCQQDIPKLCSDVIVKSENDAKLEGTVINCLKQQFAIKTLSAACEHQIRDRVKAASQDIRMAPVLLKTCRAEITSLCRKELIDDRGEGVEVTSFVETGQGRIVECLKVKFSEHKIEDENCWREVANLLVESHMDVDVDPLLNTACEIDLLTFCRQGRQMSCLLSFLDEDPQMMTAHCREMLRKRKEMWDYAAQEATPESFDVIYKSRATSTLSRKYFLVITFTVVSVVFVVGILCGFVLWKRARNQKRHLQGYQPLPM